MELSPVPFVLLLASGPPVALGLAHATGRLDAVARVVDVRRPVVIACATLWAAAAPLALVTLSGPDWLIPSVVFVWGGLAIALADLAALRAPHACSIALAVAGVGLAGLESGQHALGAAAAAVGGFVVLQAARLAFRMRRGFDGMGGGDPGVMAAMGAWSGPFAAPWVLAGACLIGLGLALATPPSRRMRARLAMAPLLVLAATLVALAGAWRVGAPFWAWGAAP